jgi:cardiolipin synthase A/B
MVLSDTTWNLYTSSQQAWDAMLNACEEAEHTIDLEQFIFTPDEIGRKFIDICAKKAARGVRVRFLWDAAGSFNFFGSSIVEVLKKKGIELVFFKTLLPNFFKIHNYRSWYFRNHRRTLVIDGKIGFTGSICISKRMQHWRETHVRLEGPVVEDMKRAFERMWIRAHEKRVPKILATENNGSEFEYLTNNPIPRHHYLYRNIVNAVRNSKKLIYITVPYFVPTHRLFRVLRLAAHRGVDIRLMIPQQSDYPIVDIAARTFFHSLLKSGVRIYLYTGRMLHTKTMVVDEDWSTVGTLNMDNISLLYNFEANIVSINSRFAGELTSHFLNDMKSCIEVTYRDFKNRSVIEKIITFLVGLFRNFL